MIKLIISDVDGTIIGRDEQIPQGVNPFVKKLLEKNILFTVATGRSENFMEERLKAMGITCPYVCSNGATVMGENGAIVRKQFYIKNAKPVAKPVIDKALEMGMSLLFTSNGVDRIVKITPWLIKEGNKHGETYDAQPFTADDWENYKVEKILVMDKIRDGRIAEIEQICKELSSCFKYVRYRDKAVELMEKTATKATGISHLLEELNIDLSEVLVIGNDDNDKEMFCLGANSAAVANASVNVLPLVDYICKGNEFEGVKEAVMHFCEV